MEENFGISPMIFRLNHMLMIIVLQSKMVNLTINKSWKYIIVMKLIKNKMEDMNGLLIDTTYLKGLRLDL